MSSFPGSTVIGTLSPAESNRLCGEFDSSPLIQAVLGEACLQNALLATAQQHPAGDAEAQTYCAIIYGACLQVPIETPPCNFGPSCHASIAELTQCVNDGVAEAQAAHAALPACATLTLSALDAADLSSELTSPPSCDIVDQKCPGASGAE